LTIDLNRKLARSSAEVVITRPGLTMRGKGLEADLAHQQVSLLSQVRTRYVPQH
jgi:lipopolysaccharide export system protein LptC